MSKQSNLIIAFVFLAITILLLITSTFAWITVNKNVDVNRAIVSTGSFNVDINIELSKNNNQSKIVNSTSDIYFILNNSIPGDEYGFTIRLNNKSNKQINVTLLMQDIISENTADSYDMRDVFYIVEGKVDVNGYSYYLKPNNNNDTDFNLFRISNLIINDSICLANDLIMEIDSNININFIIKYDEQTTDIGYNDGVFNIDGFYAYFN